MREPFVTRGGSGPTALPAAAGSIGQWSGLLADTRHSDHRTSSCKCVVDLMPIWPDDVADAPGRSATRPGPARCSSSGPPAKRRRRRGGRRGPRLPLSTMFTLVVLVVALASAVTTWSASSSRPTTARRPCRRSRRRGRRATTQRCGGCSTPRAARDHSQLAFTRDYDRADRAATVKSVDVGTLSPVKDGVATAPVTVRTRYFGTLRGTIRAPTFTRRARSARVAWTPELRLPGLKPGEEVRRGQRPGAHARRTSTTRRDGRWTPTLRAPRSPASPGASRPGWSGSTTIASAGRPSSIAALRRPHDRQASRGRRGRVGPHDDPARAAEDARSARSATSSAASR